MSRMARIAPAFAILTLAVVVGFGAKSSPPAAAASKDQPPITDRLNKVMKDLLDCKRLLDRARET